MTTPNRVLGTFCWHELHTRDRARAVDFYTKLVGWKATGTGADMYTEWVTPAGDHVGGVMDMPPGVPPEVPASWNGYVNVEDVDQSAKRAVELGGRVLAPPHDIPNVGRFCPIADPTGACLHLFKGIGDNGCKKPDMGQGTFCWVELLTHDAANAERFYTQLFGWTVSKMAMPNFEYTIFWAPGAVPEKKEGWAGGMMQIGPEWGPIPSNWLVYINVADIDAAAAMVPTLGGRILVPPADIPGVGRFSIAQDPTGGVFALFIGRSS